MKRYILLLLLGFFIPLSVFAQFKNKLRKKTVTGLALMTNSPDMILPGAVIKIGFQVVLDNGSVMNTKGFAEGRADWNNFEVYVKGGSFHEGELTISVAPSELVSRKVELTVNVLSANHYTQHFELDINYVTDLTISYDGSHGLSPGCIIPIQVTATLNNGRTVSTGGYDDSPERLKWNALHILANGVPVTGGVLVLSSDPRRYIHNRVITLSASHVSNTEIKKEISFSLDFRAAYAYNDFGAAGSKGMQGRKGHDGYSGQSGSYYRGSGSNGGQGQSGSNGQDGGRGGQGYEGPSVDVYVKAEYDQELGTLLKVEVNNRSTNESEFYIINTNGGSLTIDVSGGEGGSGGDGGRGGDGGDGGSSASTKTTNGVTIGGGNGGNGGCGGNGGDGGDGGIGGDGGTITVYADPGASAYLSLLVLVNEGGEGGRGGYGGREGSGGSGGYSYGRGSSGERGSRGHSGRQGVKGMSGRSGAEPSFIYQMVMLEW